jgi:hypothetical protein
MPASLLTRIPKIPHPPYHGLFASISSMALLGLLCTHKIPRHPLIVATWAYGSYCLNGVWLRLKLAQVKATIEWAVDTYLKKEGACEDCRKNIIQRDPEHLVKLLADLTRARILAGGTQPTGSTDKQTTEEKDTSEAAEEEEESDEQKTATEDSAEGALGPIST